MNSPQLQLGFKFNPPVDWSKMHCNVINTLIPDLLLAKCGVGRTLLPPRDQVFLMYDGISSNQSIIYWTLNCLNVLLWCQGTHAISIVTIS
jgi:hypothetical protein